MAISEWNGNLTDQLRALVTTARFNGMEDAAEFLTEIASSPEVGRCRECSGALTPEREGPFVRMTPIIPYEMVAR